MSAATAGQKARIRALVESSGRTLDDVLAMAQRYGLGQGDIETLTKVEALRLIESLLEQRPLRHVRGDCDLATINYLLPGLLPAASDQEYLDVAVAAEAMLAEAVPFALSKAEETDGAFESAAHTVDLVWTTYENLITVCGKQAIRRRRAET